MVDLDQTERVDRELNVVKRARFNQTIKVDKSNEVPETKFGVEPHTVKELPALPVRERQEDNMFLHQQLQDNMLDEEVVSFGQRAQHQQDQQQLQLRQHNIPHKPRFPETIVFCASQYACWLRCTRCETIPPKTYYRFTVCMECPGRRREDHEPHAMRVDEMELSPTSSVLDGY